MDLTALRARTRDLTDMRQTTQTPDAVIDDALNDSYAEICGAREWPFVEAAVTAATAVAALTVPAHRTLLSVTADDGQQAAVLLPATPEQAAVYARQNSGTGFPLFYASTSATTIQLLPAPERSVTVTTRYVARVTPLSPTVSPVFADEYHPMLAYGAALRLLGRSGDSSARVAAYQNEYNSFMVRMLRDYMSSDNRAPVILGGRRVSVRRRWGGRL